MFENLSDKLQDVFDGLGRRGRLTEDDVDKALRQVRLALLEADVNYKVVKDFVARVRARAIGADVMRSLTPAQQVIKIVHEELIVTLGDRSGARPAADGVVSLGHAVFDGILAPGPIGVQDDAIFIYNGDVGRQ